MIKGVNKQIIEINKTDDEFVEKAILIINPEKSSNNSNVLTKKAQEYLKTKILEDTKKSKNSLNIILIIVNILLLFLVIVLVFLLV